MVKLEPEYRELLGGLSLSDEQVEGVEFLINRVRAILAFQTGLGKTITSLVALKVLVDKYPKARGIIVCPVKATKIFKKELKSKLGYKDHEIGLVTNQEVDYDVEYNKIFIFTDTSIKKYASLVVDLQKDNRLILILDEAHKLQSNKSGLYLLMEELKPCFTAIWFCTATPILNDLDSIYNIIGFLDKNFLGTKTSFLNKYTNSRLKDIWVKGGTKRKVREIISYKDLDVLQENLKSICIMRQKKYNLQFLEEVENLTAEELKVYERVSKGILLDEDRTFGQRLHDLQRLVDNSYEDELVSVLDSTKEKLLIKTLTSIMKKDFSTVVYIDYLDTIDRVERILQENKSSIGFNNIFQIKGSIPIKEREKVEDLITQRDIILVTRAGTESINLQKANCVVMYDIPFSIKDCIQLIGRVTRMDTEFSEQFIIILWTRGTIDEYKYKLFQDYANLVRQVLGSDANLPSTLTAIDRKNLQALKDKLLWHYKSPENKMRQAKRKLLESNLIYTDDLEEFKLAIATHKVDLNITPVSVDGVKRIDQLIPTLEDYQAARENRLPTSILRNRYYDKLKTPEGKLILGNLVDSIVNKRSVIMLYDDRTLVGELLRDFILKNIIL